MSFAALQSRCYYCRCQLARTCGSCKLCCCSRDFGNNPDISKALRLLVAEKNVKRVGKGGRVDPFAYQVMHTSHSHITSYKLPAVPQGTKSRTASTVGNLSGSFGQPCSKSQPHELKEHSVFHSNSHSAFAFLVRPRF